MRRTMATILSGKITMVELIGIGEWSSEEMARRYIATLVRIVRSRWPTVKGCDKLWGCSEKEPFERDHIDEAPYKEATITQASV
eukprot:7387795-Prymnesium_polylepis.2